MRRVTPRSVVVSFTAVARIEASIAQTGDSGTPGLQEVIVAALKRAENVDAVPMVVSVLTNQPSVHY
jgi:hypothetical protein